MPTAAGWDVADAGVDTNPATIWKRSREQGTDGRAWS